MKEMHGYDWISKWALYSPDHIALEEHGTNSKINFADLNQFADNLSFYLTHDLKLMQGDRIACLSLYSIDYVILLVACQKTGIILVPLNYRLSSSELTEILDDADVRYIYSQENFKNLISSQFHALILDIHFQTKQSSSPQFAKPQILEDDPIMILYTSGTSGKAKGVLYSHKMMFWNSINTAISLHLNANSKTIIVMPPFHTGGWNVLLTPLLHFGGYSYLMQKFEAKEVMQKILETDCNLFMAVPTMLSMMAQESSFESWNPDKLKYIIVGGEAMPLALIDKFAKKNISIRQGYGMTEVGPNLTSLHQDDAIRKMGSIGRPNFYVEVKIVKENGEAAAVNENGELWIKGPMVTKAYFRNETASSLAFTEDKLWFKTGDIVRQDEEQYLYIVDRLKNMYISGGENVYPAEIERVLRKMESIKECAVIGISDAKWGEVGKAFIVVNSPLTEVEIIAHCQQNLAKFKIPKQFVFISELPKTDSGKINHKALKLI